MPECIPRIAIVDDNDSVLRAMDRMMRSLGMQPSTYTCARDFLSELEADSMQQPDCLILDNQMPGITGLELQKLLAEKGCRVPIIMISGHEDPVARDCALAAGAIAFLRKPFKDDALISTLHEVLDQTPD